MLGYDYNNPSPPQIDYPPYVFLSISLEWGFHAGIVYSRPIFLDLKPPLKAEKHLTKCWKKLCPSQMKYFNSKRFVFSSSSTNHVSHSHQLLFCS
jgi:hypothetical protein